jgi:hypothetical protein
MGERGAVAADSGSPQRARSETIRVPEPAAPVARIETCLPSPTFP